MALIKCNECGKEISDTAKRCLNCGYKIKKESNGTLKWILIILIPTILIIAGIIITMVVINSTPKEDKEENKSKENNTSTSYKMKEYFADEAASFVKAAETAYVDKSLDGAEKNMYTVKELLDEYVSSSNNDYKGCIILEVDRNGYIGDKTVYLTNGKHMIIDETIDDIFDDIDYAVDEYDSLYWEKDYEKCDVSQ